MLKVTLKTHAEVLARQGDKFYIQSSAGNVYATLCVDGSVAYQCVTDESPENAISPNDNRLNNALSVEGFDIT